MKIFYVSVIEQNAGWGAEWLMERAFRAMNHSTYCVDYRVHRYHLMPYFWNAPQNDVFFLQRGDYFPIPLIKSIQIPRFFWASELVSRCRDQDRLLKSGLFSHIFVRTNACIDTIVQKGWIERNKCSVLLSSFDESLFRVIPGIQKDIQILFVGFLTPRRKILLDQLKQRFNIFVTSSYGEDFVRLINRAEIVLNIHADDYLDTETRVFETLGCGAFLLTEKLSPENPFANGELVQAETIDELPFKLEYYLQHRDERETIAKNGYQAALSSHTYLHRAREIIDVMSGFVKDNEDHPSTTLRKDWRTIVYGIEEAAVRSGQPFARRARNILNEYRHRNHLV